MGHGRTSLARTLGLCLTSVTCCWVSHLLLCLPSHCVATSVFSVAILHSAKAGVLLRPKTQPDGVPAPAWPQEEPPSMLDFPAITLACQIPPLFYHLPDLCCSDSDQIMLLTEKNYSSKYNDKHEKVSHLNILLYTFFLWQALDKVTQRWLLISRTTGQSKV